MPPEVSFVLYPRPLGSRGAYHDSRISAKSMLHLGPEYHDRVNYRVHVKFLSNLERVGGFDPPFPLVVPTGLDLDDTRISLFLYY